MKQRVGITLLVAVICVFTTGCSRDVASLDKREEKHPLMARALNRKRMQDIDGAVKLYEEIIRDKPSIARAHLELGLLYDSYKEDYMRALYHYQRYLELRPDTEKREMIENIMKMAKLSFAATLPHNPSDTIEEIGGLKRENSMLKTRINDLEKSFREAEGKARAAELREEEALLARIPDPPANISVEPPPDIRESIASNRRAPVADTRPRRVEEQRPLPPPVLVRPEPVPAKPPVQTYRVQRGDTLSSIASKMYNDPKQWKKIFDANKDKLKRPESIRVGQTLEIPR